MFKATSLKNLIAVVSFLLLNQQLIAQCSGNVLFYENFGGGISSPLTGPRLPAGVTTYSFDSLGLVDDGQYGIRKTTADIATGGRQFGVWHIGTDRSSGGNMMIVNADYTAGKFYETTVANLCSGSQLYFSAWIANLIPLGSNNPLDPIIRFEISSATSGNVLQTFNTPSISRFSNFTWERFGFLFALPAGETSVILRIFNNQVGGLGNDLALDDIEFTLCGPTMSSSVSGTLLNTNDACVGSTVDLNINVAGGFYSNPAYQWQFNNGTGWTNIPAATTPNLSLSNIQKADSGNYRLLVAEAVNINSNNCRSVSPIIPVNVFAPVSPMLQSNAPVCETKDLILNVPVDAIAYIWTADGTPLNMSNDTLRVVNATTGNSGMYHVRLITKGGCSSADSVAVVVQSNLLQRTIPLDTLLCDAQTLDVDAQQPTAVSYLWNDGTTAAQRTLTNTGSYSLLTSDGVCSRTDSFVITRNFTPTVQLIGDTTLCVNEPLVLNATHPLAEFYLWNNNATDSSITVTLPGIYSVAVGNGCGIAIDDITVDYKDCADVIFVPNAFTPNGDRLNDVLKAKVYFRIDEFEFRIFNRWGQLIFSTNDVAAGWDGFINSQKAPPGQYVWTIRYKRNDKSFNQKGTVLLIP
ncbi:T9SS type B sorting domain-containing protein [Lacibacter sp. H407]|uniref:T9SS type B sorting domain-containing protein n=1 Tax=Lacibacter sp. H407 TaxID=3133423 RepID=UPI0030C14797